MSEITKDTVRALAICLAMQLAVTTACVAAGCTPELLKTPAVYIEHVGDSDKPIYPIVIATRRPSEQELRCAAPSLLSVEVFLVTEEELARATELWKQHGGGGKRTATLGKGRSAGEEGFRYVLVSRHGIVETGELDLKRSKEFFTALATYFSARQPKLHDHLIVTMRRF